MYTEEMVNCQMCGQLNKLKPNTKCCSCGVPVIKITRHIHLVCDAGRQDIASYRIRYSCKNCGTSGLSTSSSITCPVCGYPSERMHMTHIDPHYPQCEHIWRS